MMKRMLALEAELLSTSDSPSSRQTAKTYTMENGLEKTNMMTNNPDEFKFDIMVNDSSNESLTPMIHHI